MRQISFGFFVIIALAVLFQNCSEGPSSLAPLLETSTPPLVSDQPAVKFVTLPNFGDVFYDLGGTRGLILCFHGRGGSAAGWTTDDNYDFLIELRKRGYSFLCPTSLDRVNKQWSNTRTSSNVDVLNVDQILDYFQVSQNTNLFLVGHSNGGGFNNFFSLLSLRKMQIRAIQFSNAAGITTALTNPAYTYDTLFNFADCDPIVSATDVRNSIAVLQSKVPAVVVNQNDLDVVYQSGSYSTCHQFVNTAPETFDFFEASLVN